ncbi:MAG TPA: MFS transporter [Acidimicrobiia bacterium]|nr:MFS transporter [Acidimicrobiia bacterium]
MTEPPVTRRARIGTFLGLQRATVGVLLVVVLVGSGEHLAERFLPIYLLALGGGTLLIGLLQAMDNLLSALYSYPGGYLADRIGPRRSLVVFNLVAMAGYAIVIAIPAWPAVLAGAVLFISWSAISAPATLSVIYRMLPAGKRTMGVTMHSLVRRVPMALGPVLGGVFIAVWGERDGVRAAFGAALVLAAVALVFQQRMIPADPPREKAGSVRFHPGALLRRMSPAMRNLLVSDILIRFCEQIPYAFVVVWAMKTIESPVTAVQFGLLTTIEMATAVLIYVPVAAAADRLTKKPFVLATFGFFTVFPLVLLVSRSFGWLIVAFVVRGLKEFGEPTRKSLIMDLSPQDARAAMFGLYYLIRDLVVSLAALGGAFLWMISPDVNLLAAFGFGVAGTIWFAVFGRDVSPPGSR